MDGRWDIWWQHFFAKWKRIFCETRNTTKILLGTWQFFTRNMTKILLLWWMGGERLVTPRAWFCKIKKRKKIANWRKKELLWGLSCQGLVTQQSFCKWKDTFFPKIFNTKWSLSMLIRNRFWGHPKNYMLCQHMGLQYPLKLEIEKCWWIKGLKMKESKKFIHEHFSIFLQ